MTGEIFIIIIILLLLLHYLFFIFKIYSGLHKLTLYNFNNITVHPFISIIIPFRNETSNILACLKSLQKQDYPPDSFEILFVDDNSDDDSADKLKKAVKPDSFKILSLKQDNSAGGFKKRAVAAAIKEAKGEIILTTDADCIHKAGWIKAMVSYFDPNTGMVAGPVEFRESVSFFDKIQQLEFRGLILAGAGLIGSGAPVTCSAANLAYRKSVFYEVGGFNDNLNLSSGDDELLMQKIYHTGKYKIKFSTSGESLVTTCANKTIDDFFNQRKRWASKGIFYKDKILVLRLILIFFFYVGIIFSVIASFFSSIFIPVLFISIVSKSLPEYLVMREGEKLIFKKGLLRYFLAAEFFQLIYILIAAIMGLFGNLKWKGRIVKR